MKSKLLLINVCLSIILGTPIPTLAFEDLTQATISCVQANLTPLEKLQKEIEEEIHGKEDVGINALPYPIVRHTDTVSYVSGGISADEVRFMQCMQPHFPFTLVFVERIDGHAKEVYVADVHMTLTDTEGNVVLDTLTDGPFLLMSLAEGDYTVTANYNGIIKERKASTKHNKRQRMVFLWDNRTTADEHQTDIKKQQP